MPASQSFVPPPPPVTICVPSGEKLTLVIPLVCPFRSSRGVPVRASQTFAVLSSPPVTIRVPSGEKLTLLTAPVCPFRSNRSVPVCASHTFALPSSLLTAISAPRPESLTLGTMLVRAFRSSRSVRPCMFHTFALLSIKTQPLVAIRAPSGEKLTPSTWLVWLVCAFTSSTGMPVRASQTFAVRPPLVKIRAEKLTLLVGPSRSSAGACRCGRPRPSPSCPHCQ